MATVQGIDGNTYSKNVGEGAAGRGWTNTATGEKVSGISTARTGNAAKLGGGSGISYGRGISASAIWPEPPAEPPIEFYLGKAPTLKELSLDYGDMGKKAYEANAPFRQQFQEMNPDLEAGLRSLSASGAQMATGQLSRDMIGEIGRSTAAAGFSGGFGGRSGMGRNLLARDFGLSSLRVKQQGANLLSQSVQISSQAMQAMNQIDPTAVFSTEANRAKINLDIQNQNLMNEYQSQPLPGQFDIKKGMYVGYEPGTYSKLRPDSPDTAAWKKKEKIRQSTNAMYVGDKLAAENRRRLEKGEAFVGEGTSGAEKTRDAAWRQYNEVQTIGARRKAVNF
jgi:hypothetical protein